MITIEDITVRRYLPLVEEGILNEKEFLSAADTAEARAMELERVLLREYGVSKSSLLGALSHYYGLPCMEYDEKLPIPPELLEGLDGERLSLSLWFPVISEEGRVVIAANNPEDPTVREEVEQFACGKTCEFMVALSEDIQWYIQDFLHAKPGRIIGTERTGLAWWRNTMAHWRTRMACYRTDMAKARTSLAFLRWGLGLVTLSTVLSRLREASLFYTLMAVAGFGIALFGLWEYLRIRKSSISPPGNQTLVEVTAATVSFLENYHFIEGSVPASPMKGTMLARLGDFAAGHCTIMYPSPSSRERTHLARERNVLAAQRTVAACYRTIYARARTGLAFIRSGVSFSALGIGFLGYFGRSLLTVADAMVVIFGAVMIADGLLWYLPVRKEQAEVPRCPVPEE